MTIVSKSPSLTYRQPTPDGTAFVTVASDHVIINVGKCGSRTRATAEAIGRLVSLFLRPDDPGTPLERLRLVADQLAGIGGGDPVGFGPGRVASLPDGIARALREHLAATPCGE